MALTGLDAFDMYGIRRDNQFEVNGRATESNEITWHAWITKEYANDEKEYGSGDWKTFREVAEWPAFHLERLHTLRKEEDDSTRIEKALEGFDDDDQVVMSKDGEGNDYSPLADLGSDTYAAGSTWNGEPRVPAACRNRSVAFDYGKSHGWPAGHGGTRWRDT